MVGSLLEASVGSLILDAFVDKVESVGLSVVLLLLFAFLLSSEAGESSVPGSGILGETVLNDDGVWNGLERSDLDLSVGFAGGLELGWSDGKLVGSLGALLSQNSEWEFDGRVLLNDNLVFPQSLWNLKGQAGSELSSNSNVSISSDLVSGLEGDLSDSGDDDWSLNLECDGPSEESWGFLAEFNWSGSLLGVDLEGSSSNGVDVFLRGDLPDEFSEFGGLGDSEESLEVELGDDEHLIPHVDGSEDLGDQGLSWSSDGDGGSERSDFERVGSQNVGSSGVKLNEVPLSAFLDESESLVNSDFGAVLEFLSQVDVLGHWPVWSEGLLFFLLGNVGSLHSLDGLLLHSLVEGGNWSLHSRHGLDGRDDVRLVFQVDQWSGRLEDLSVLVRGGVLGWEDH